MKRFLGFLIIALFLIFPDIVKAQSLIIYENNFKITAGNSVYWTLSLNKDDFLVIYLSANKGVNLYIRDSFGKQWWFGKNIPYKKAIFVAPYNGVYRLYVDNSYSIITDKYVNISVYYIPADEIKQFLLRLPELTTSYLTKLKSYNPKLELPKVIYTNCGQVNAFYEPNTNTIVICTDLVSNIISFELLNDINNWKYRTQEGVSFTFFHELGHALINLCKLPVLGKEEDAADALATLAALEINPEIAYEGAILFLNLLNSETPIFWDSHSPAQERFYDILCWLYGSNPKYFFFIKREYPELQYRNCQYEYYQLENSWTKLLKQCGFKFNED